MVVPLATRTWMAGATGRWSSRGVVDRDLFVLVVEAATVVVVVAAVTRRGARGARRAAEGAEDEHADHDGHDRDGHPSTAGSQRVAPEPS